MFKLFLILNVQEREKMISCITHENLNEFGHILHSSFELRHESFIERQDYNVSVYNGLEFDQYDTPAAVYLVYHNEEGVALGVNRLTPTILSGMLNDLFPQFVDNKNLLKNKSIWEGTRYCITKNITPQLRQKIINEMAIAYLEFGLDQGINKIIGMMPTYIYRSVFERRGIEMEYLGQIHKIDRQNVRAVAIPIDNIQLKNIQNKTGIQNRILRYSLNQLEDNYEFKKAA